MIKYNINTINNNINKYINTIVHVRYDKKEGSDTPDKTGVVLLGLCDEGFDTSAANESLEIEVW